MRYDTPCQFAPSICVTAKAGDFQSALTPLALIGTAHLSISFLTNSPRYCGVMCSSEATSAPIERRRSRTAGVLAAATMAALSFLTIGSGVSLGRNTALQV